MSPHTKKGKIKNEEAAFPNYRSKNNITMQKKVVTVFWSHWSK